MERVAFTSQFNGTPARGWSTTRARVSSKPRRRSSRALKAHSSDARLRRASREPPEVERPYVCVWLCGVGWTYSETSSLYFKRNPLLSAKQQEFLTFAAIVSAMACGEHLTVAGFERLSDMARRMNGDGKYRRKGGALQAASYSSSRILRDQMPGTHLPRQVSEGMVRSAWRHAEPGRNALAIDMNVDVTRMSVPIRCSRRRSEKGCP